MIEADEVDKSLGMDYYLYEELYLGDVLSFRKNPKNFRVYEVSLDDTEVSLKLCSSELPKTQGRFAYFIMCKEGVDMFYVIQLLRELFRAKVGYAGLKDCESYSCQLISVDTKYLKDLKHYYRLNRIELCFYKYLDYPLMSGHLLGNVFNVFFKFKKYGDEVKERLSSIETYLNSTRLINYYGYQRFGSVRPTTHLVGKSIINRNWYEAVRVIAGSPSRLEDRAVRIAREEFELGNYYRAFYLFPPEYWMERRVCKVMYVSNDPLKAIKSLPKDVIRFYIEAYQSYIFNKMLSKALKYFKDVEILRNTCETLVVPGYNTTLNDSICSSIARDIIECEGVKPRDFIIKELGIISKGYVRSTTFKVENLDISYDEEGVWFNFMLKSGSYASIFLRELFRKT